MTAHCRLGTLLVVLAIVVGSPGLAAANMANPVMAGDPVGEPSGELKQVAIERETLDLDLRPLSDDQPTRISATYAVRNDGPAASLDLLFIAPGLAARSPSDFGVWLDDASVPATIAPNLTLPSSWRPPATTPGLDGKGSLSYLTRSDRGLRIHHCAPCV